MMARPMARVLCACLATLSLAATGQCRHKADQENEIAPEVRRPVVAGAFYPDDPQVLAQQVDRFLQNVPPQNLPGPLMGLVVPHAGYVFSGQVAAYSYKALQGKEISTVILIGCSHRAGYSGASIYPQGRYATPLGEVPIDEEMAEQLMSRVECLRYLPVAHQAEHSLEVQLPFLQRTLGDFQLVPILLGSQCSFPELESLADAIAQLSGGTDQVLLVASTDMSHYPAYDDACRVDGETLKILETFDPQALAEHERHWLKEGVPGLHCTMCATEAVMVVMMAAQAMGADGVKILKYANSADVPMGDRDKVVGYCAAALYREEKNRSEAAPVMDEKDHQLDPQEQQQLLRIARESIAAALRGQTYSPPEEVSGRLREHRGAFVTLHKGGALRGCIGQFLPDVALTQTVAQMAQAAAFHDGRFPPLGAEELDQVEIEISVLSPLREISSIDEIQMGIHGIWITREGRSGCYLPQVATQTGWSKKEFLEHCCRDKALLSKDAYLQEGTHISVFTAQVFHEH